MLSLEEAQSRIVAALRPLGPESVALANARGRVLADDIVAGLSQPAFDNSAMDGYAVLASDCAKAMAEQPVRLRLGEIVAAGSPSQARVERGHAARIFTGAPIPPGADAVVMQEDVRVEGEDVLVSSPVPVGQHLRRAGEDVAAGQPLFGRGAVLGSGDLGMLAADGHALVRVQRRPRVALLPTGDEVIEIDRPLGPGQIRNSNAHMLAAQAEEAGAVVLRLPAAADDPERLARALAEAARGADLVLTCGGVSVGDFDHVRQVLGQGGRVDFWQVAIKPGKPLAFGELAGTPLIGLPGNPVSSFVCFEMFARPALRRLAGLPPWRARQRVRLRSGWPAGGKRRELLRARLERQATGELWAVPARHQGSAHLTSLVGVQALLDLPAGGPELAAGADVWAWVLDEVPGLPPGT